MAVSYYFSKTLTDMLLRIPDYPLTIIEAESGYGKTSAVQECFVPSVKGRYRYFQYTCLGESGRTAWSGICRIFGHIDAEAANYMKALDIDNKDTCSEIAYQMSLMTCGEPTVLCIDNFQLLDLPDREMFLRALSCHYSSMLHIVVLTQPQAETGRFALNLSGVLYIPARSLLFSREDIRRFFRQEEITLTDEELQLIWEMSEGFASAVRLQLESKKYYGRLEPSGQLSYLMEKALWNHLDEEEKNCLISLAVLDSFSLRQAVAVSGWTGSPQKLSDFLRKNSFVRFDEENGRYLFHHLLAVYLMDRQKHWSADARRRLTERIARSYVEEKNYVQAARYFAQIEDFQTLLSLPYTLQERKMLLEADHGKICQALIEPRHRAVLAEYPAIALSFTFEFLISGNMLLFQQYYTLVEGIFSGPPLQDGHLAGELALLQSFLAFNDIKKMCGLHRRAYALMSGPTSLFSANAAWTFGSPSIVCMFWREPGGLTDTLELIVQGMPVYYKLSDGNGTGAAAEAGAETALLRGQDEMAMALYKKALFEAERMKQDSISYCVKLGMARIAILRGDAASLTHMREKINDAAYNGKESLRVFMTTVCETAIHIMLGEYGEIPEWLIAEESVRRYTMAFTVPYVHILSGALMLRRLKKRQLGYQEFKSAMEEYLAESDYFHMLFPRIYFLIFLAIASKVDGRRLEAFQAVREALEAAGADQVCFPFAVFYEDLRDLLEALVVPAGKREYLCQIHLLGRRFLAGKQKILSIQQSNDTALTPREYEVAKLLKQRYSVKEIAERLYISPSTVSNTMQKIYGKLGIHSKKELYSRENL